jgi:hypothetical protein
MRPPEELAAFVAASRRAQGLPRHVIDPEALRQVAVLLAGKNDETGLVGAGSVKVLNVVTDRRLRGGRHEV